ncbi:hypothetical protein [Mycobacterium sp.]|uniref:hypothetical protein n=1 Tax=Mycobacterium sp. TaxID=1785 RepID=UPI003D0D1FB3
MSSSLDHSPELRTAVDAMRGAIDDAQRQLDRAHQVKLAVTAVAIAALRQRGLADGHIGRLLDLDADAVTEAAEHPDPAADGVPDWELRAEIEQLWMAVRRQASVWMQVDEVTTSAQVVERNGIDPGSWPLAVRALDTPGAEFAHQSGGQVIVVYSLQARDGTPTIVNDAITSWDYWGQYNVEFVARPGSHSPLDLSSFGLIPSAHTFRRRDSREELMAKAFPSASGGPAAGRSAAESFANIVAAIRRMCGPLPPYGEVARGITDDVAAR